MSYLNKIYSLWRDDFEIIKNLMMSFFIYFWKILMGTGKVVWIFR